MAEDSARIPEQSVMEVINRALTEAPSADRVVIVFLSDDNDGGDRVWQFTNARSSAELAGMYVLAGGLRNLVE